MTVNATTSASTPASSSTSATPLNSLAGNFNDFLKLLMTQLQNQDPTSPMDTNAFTSQLVQYASVEQQINANSNLTKLIQATQSNTLLQSSSLVGKQVDVLNDHLALQNGSAALHFDTDKPETVNIGVYSASGTKLLQTTVQTQAGTNNWTWDGRDSQGNQLPDGSYKVAVVDPSGTALATTITGTVTGLQRSSDAVSVSLGSLQTDIATIQSVVNKS
jgi:flagellar basal-body rod modification protein FlgD